MTAVLEQLAFDLDLGDEPPVAEPAGSPTPVSPVAGACGEARPATGPRERNPVKAITVQQPWASLIMARATNPRAKDIENRTWTTNHRGPLAIHAGKAIDRDGFPYAEYHRIELPDPLPLGVILGTVTLVDVVRDALSSWASGGQWNWVLADPAPFTVPVPARGSLGLWDWDGPT